MAEWMKLAKRKYVPDLSEYMAQCEMNYALMARLLRCVGQVSQVQIQGSHCNSGGADAYFDASSLAKDVFARSFASEVELPIQVTLLEQARYTTTLEMTMNLSDSAWVSPLVLKVRMYHDAKMAEVLEPGRNHAPRPKHDYPAQVCHYPDDKFQRNQLLNLCLSRCFDVGAKTVTLPKVIDLTQGS
jgi:hypothetical protein